MAHQYRAGTAGRRGDCHLMRQVQLQGENVNGRRLQGPGSKAGRTESDTAGVAPDVVVECQWKSNCNGRTVMIQRQHPRKVSGLNRAEDSKTSTVAVSRPTDRQIPHRTSRPSALALCFGTAETGLQEEKGWPASATNPTHYERHRVQHN
jgi:hypothetical protein